MKLYRKRKHIYHCPYLLLPTPLPQQCATYPGPPAEPKCISPQNKSDRQQWSENSGQLGQTGTGTIWLRQRTEAGADIGERNQGNFGGGKAESAGRQNQHQMTGLNRINPGNKEGEMCFQWSRKPKVHCSRTDDCGNWEGPQKPGSQLVELLQNHQVPDFPPASVEEEDGFQQTTPLGCTHPLPFPLDLSNWRFTGDPGVLLDFLPENVLYPESRDTVPHAGDPDIPLGSDEFILQNKAGNT